MMLETTDKSQWYVDYQGIYADKSQWYVAKYSNNISPQRPLDKK